MLGVGEDGDLEVSEVAAFLQDAVDGVLQQQWLRAMHQDGDAGVDALLQLSAAWVVRALDLPDGRANVLVLRGPWDGV